MRLIDLLQQYRIFAVLCAVSLPLLIWYFVVYAKTMRPREGTLEWIGMYDKARFTLSRPENPFAVRDVGAAALAAVCAAAALLLRYGMLAAAYGASLRNVLTSSAFLLALVFTAFGAAGMYLLLQSLLRDRPAAFCAAALYGFASYPHSGSAALLVLSLLFLWMWLRQDACAPLWKTVWWWLLSIAAFAAAMLWLHSLVWLSVLYLFCFLLKLFSRVRAKSAGKKITPVWLSVLLMLLLALLAGIALAAAADLRGVRITPEALSSVLTAPSFYLDLLRRVPHVFARVLCLPGFDALRSLRHDWPIALCGTAAAIAACFGLRQRRETPAAAIAVLFAALALLWLFTNTWLLPLAALPAIGWVFHGFRTRGSKLPVYLCLALSILFYLADWIVLYFIK
jgi:hypothetical protein